jgi:catechol 2,3-dioxygenase-like lactoylglutathione lyase family enzyme
MDVRFVASVSVIAPDPKVSRELYVDSLGLPLKHMGGDYFASEEVPGCKHFGVWPLTEAAQACFGTGSWPPDRPVPQVSIEFDVENVEAVAAAARELADRGHTLVHSARTEPWGQTIARLQSPEGAIIGVSYSPHMH